MRLNKKIAVIAASAFGAAAIGTGAWAYVTSTGTGAGTATASAAQNTVHLDASATITDLDTPVAVSVGGYSTAANRHINTLTVAVDTASLASGPCASTTFTIGHSGTAFSGYTFTTAGTSASDDTALTNDFTITMVNNPAADQTACLTQSIPLLVSAS